MNTRNMRFQVMWNRLLAVVEEQGQALIRAAFSPIVREFNYGGELDFMHQALAQREARQLVVEDGWLYFLHGWTQVIAQVLDVEISADTLDHLGEVASFVRPQRGKV